MQIKVSGETPFKCLKETFVVGKSSNGYTLAYGVDKTDLIEYSEATPADEDLIVNGATPYMWFALKGNEGEVDIIV